MVIDFKSIIKTISSEFGDTGYISDYAFYIIRINELHKLIREELSKMKDPENLLLEMYSIQTRFAVFYQGLMLRSDNPENRKLYNKLYKKACIKANQAKWNILKDYIVKQKVFKVSFNGSELVSKEFTIDIVTKELVFGEDLKTVYLRDSDANVCDYMKNDPNCKVIVAGSEDNNSDIINKAKFMFESDILKEIKELDESIRVKNVRKNTLECLLGMIGVCNYE